MAAAPAPSLGRDVYPRAEAGAVYREGEGGEGARDNGEAQGGQAGGVWRSYHRGPRDGECAGRVPS